MTSSALTGEQRWASTRRGGSGRLTVIGKVVVPKPINLPSIRLENHGLGPSVEIVPKGNLNWSNRSSSSASNAWGSSMLSPNTDGGTGSPSRLSGCPSSGGSGTRPSTASSDRAHEPTANAWGPNSRPSSASGALTSNQTPVASLRPRSAETRPGSSQLSRFAELLSENSVAWGAAGTAEKLGVTSSKNDEFSLSSGDFPTLGSEKDNSTKIIESQEHGFHGRPGSSSGGVPPLKERTGASTAGDVSVNESVKSGTANTWRRENFPYVQDGVRPNVEKWQGDPQLYPNSNMPPHHFDPWHGAPVGNSPGSVWYRGPPGGHPYGTPVAPGGFPMEPYPYYRPQIPATAIANSQPVPSPGVRPRGHHPKNGDMYRPHMPDAYIRPGMPIRPGFYPGPVAYEGYYGPPMGYCNASEHDIPFMGMTAGPSVYNMYASQNAPDSSNFHGRSSGYGSTGKALVSEQVESGHPHDPRGQYKVLLKQHNNLDGKEEEQKWENAATTNGSSFEKGDRPRMSSWEDDWRADYKEDEQMDSRRMAVGKEAFSQTFDNQEGSFVPVKVKLAESVGTVKPVDDSSVKKLENAVSACPEVSATPKDSTLIQKIEGLNAKARASDAHDVSSKEERNNRLHPNAKGIHSTNEASTVHERTYTSGIHNPASYEVGVSTGDKNLEPAAASGTAIPRRATHGVQGRVDHRGKGRFNAQEADVQWKKSPVADSSSVVSASNSETSNVHLQDGYTSAEAAEKSLSYLEGKDEGESAISMFDPSDIQAQRAKMREIAKQRVKQLQKEEEERTREQKAKALAKLEELNRRMQAVEGSTQKLEIIPSSGPIHQKQDESQTLDYPTTSTSNVEASNATLVSNTNVVAQNSESSASRVGECTILSRDPLLEAPRNACQESVVVHKQSLHLQQDVHIADAAKVDPLHHDSNVSKQKRMGYKQKHNIPLEKSLTEKSTTSTTEAPKGHNDVEFNVPASAEVVDTEIASSCESSLHVNQNVIAESSVHQRRKNYKSRNKHKLEEVSSMAAVSPSLVPKETYLGKAFVESGKPKASEFELDPSSVQPLTSSKDAIQSSEQRSSLPSEEVHGRVNNQWKSQNPLRLPRNQRVNRSVEKFHGGDAVIWAPVRSQNKSEVTDEASHKTVFEEAVTPTTKSDHPVQNILKNKRAEMERYVPKPVAKELAQQVCIQQHTSLSINQNISDETVGRAEFGSQSAESTQLASAVIGKVGESRNGDSKQNKQTKAHASRRQWSSTESTRVQGLQDGSSFTSKPGKDEESIEHKQPLKPDLHSVKGQRKSFDEWDASDGWNMPDNPESAAPVTFPVVKDQGVTGRGKRQLYKGQRGMGNNNHDHLDHKNTNSGDTDKNFAQSSAIEACETDRTVASRENRGVGEHSTSHWQPKSQAYSAHNQRGSRPSGGQNVAAEVGRFIKKESAPQGGVHLLQKNDKETSEGMSRPHSEQSMSVKSSVGEVPNAGHQEAKRERKVASLKGRSHSLNPGSVDVVEPAPPAGVDSRLEQQPLSSVFRKNGNQNSRFGRGHESWGDWSSAGQDNKQHNLPANRERQRHNAHYEYQPIVPYNNNKSSNFEGATDGSHSTSSKFRERGPSHSRRGGGNFHGRQSGTVRVDAGYD